MGVGTDAGDHRGSPQRDLGPAWVLSEWAAALCWTMEEQPLAQKGLPGFQHTPVLLQMPEPVAYWAHLKAWELEGGQMDGQHV